MKAPDDIWEEIGSLTEEELFHVITKLYAMYEDMLKKDPSSQEAMQFFKNMDIVITQTAQCNFNRR